MNDSIVRDVSLYKYLTNTVNARKNGKPSTINCQIVDSRPGGYIALIDGINDAKAFLITQTRLAEKQSVTAEFVCVRDNLIWLTNHSDRESFQVDAAIDTFAPPKAAASSDEITKQARSLISKYNAKRGVDLFLCTCNESSAVTYKTSECDPGQLVQKLTHEASGIFIASNEQILSRSIMLIYQGRSIGLIHSCRSREAFDTSNSIFLSDLFEADTIFRFEKLPSEHILPLATLLVGHPAPPVKAKNAQKIVTETVGFIERKQLTACISMTAHRAFTALTYLILFAQGKFTGVVHVETREFFENYAALAKIIAADSNWTMEYSALSNDAKDSKSFGTDMASIFGN